MSVSATSHWSLPELLKTSFRIGMHLSVDGSCDAVSDTIKIAAFSFEFVVLILDEGVTLMVELLSRIYNVVRAHGPPGNRILVRMPQQRLLCVLSCYWTLIKLDI